MLKVTFTFCANRESSPQQAMALFKEHFPGATRLGYANRLDNFYRVTCSSEEFCEWIYMRDQMGFVNRMHQLNIKLEQTQHFSKQRTQEQASFRPSVGQLDNPIIYQTPTTSGVR